MIEFKFFQHTITLNEVISGLELANRTNKYLKVNNIEVLVKQ